jgi:hypothetical protein
MTQHWNGKMTLLISDAAQDGFGARQKVLFQGCKPHTD